MGEKIEVVKVDKRISLNEHFLKIFNYLKTQNLSEISRGCNAGDSRSCKSRNFFFNV